jgi:hypothetical protein
MIQRLAKSMISDNSRPGFAFPCRGVHSLRWKQIQALVKLDTSWKQERTWKYNSVNPGKAFVSLMDRIRKDPVFRMNLTMQGGWTEETYHILIKLVEIAREEKRWNQLFGGMPYEERAKHYRKREQWYHASGRDKLPIPVYPGVDEGETRQVFRLGKGGPVMAASKTRSNDPVPEVRYSEVWQIAQAEIMGYDTTEDFLQSVQYRALDGAAGSSKDAVVPITLSPQSDRLRCLQCREPAAYEDLWQCEKCTTKAGRKIYFHCPSYHNNCFRTHERHCRMATMFEWRSD